ncbi:MAG: universal stress protein [Paracoccaceae bacterium]
MYSNIMVPVDLRHLDRLGKALKTAADLARHYGAKVCYVGVTAETPGALAHNPEEYAAKLADFAAAQSAEHGIEATSKPLASHDPAIDLDHTLREAAEEIGSDLVVMATHMPNVTDYIWPSHGGRLATHSDASVFLVRGN